MLTAENKRLWHLDKTGEGPDADRTPTQRLADGATNLLFSPGGSKKRITPEVIVTIELDRLADPMGRTAPVTTSSGITLTTEAIRRMACDAPIGGGVRKQGQDPRYRTCRTICVESATTSLASP